MTEARRCFRYEDYTVGWISALSVELAAAIEMLDQRHYDLPQNPNSSTIYTLGSIGAHNVVMACLSAGDMGIGSAATIATEMRTIFPCLRFGLLVGIGGGVPSTTDIRLGDVVVSQPRAGREGIVQYDFGKATISGFQRTKRLNAPPDILLNALSNYQARNLDINGDLISHHFKPKKVYPALQKFPAPDLLFKANYHHGEDTTCESCDHAQLSKDPNRDHRRLMVHYGTIASGNQVIKSGAIRDQLSDELGGILCFEMEAAGIMHTFPSLVIRGICDYADSHKNKSWQPFAALSAAAYSKELLDIVPAIQPISLSEASDTTKSLKKFRISRSSSRFMNGVDGSQNYWSDYAELVKYEFTIESISDYHPIRTHRDFARNRCPGTTHWILDHETYLQWYAAESSSCLWLTGKIGSGKTLVTSTVIERFLQGEGENDRATLHYFCRHSHKADLHATAFLKSCIKQMLMHLELTNQSCPPAIESYIRYYCGPSKENYHFNEMIENAFIPLADTIEGIVLVLDGLDECDNEEVQAVLKIIRVFMKGPDRKVFISGRASLDITNSVPGSLCIRISDQDAATDISGYIRWKLEEKMLERRIVDDLRVLAEIEAILLENAEQMILWVKLQIDNLWEDCSGDADIRAALKNLPRDLTETYDRCVERINSNKGIYSRGYATKILSWMLEAIQPLTMTQLGEALSIAPDKGTIRHNMIPSVQDILRSCANLVVQNNNNQVILAHHSVYQYLKTSPKVRASEEDLGRLLGLRTSSSITLAGLCIGHLLCEDYALAVQTVNKGSTLRLESSEVIRLTASIPLSLRSFLPQPKPIQVNLPASQPKSTKMATLPAFFHYAREQWPDLTRGWISSNTHYNSFATLALQPNLTWRLHPWKPLGQSLDSHYFGLLGWSISQNHQSLFEVLFNASHATLREDIFTAPFHLYDGLNCVLLAARSGTPWVFDYIPKTVLSTLIKSKDHKGWTVLHYAVEFRSKNMIEQLLYLFTTLQVPRGEYSVAALELAIEKDDEKVVRLFLSYPDLLTSERLLNAITTAIRYGRHKILAMEEMNIHKVMPRRAKDIEKALLDATKHGHTEAVRVVLSTIRYNRVLVSHWREWRERILVKAIHCSQRDIFSIAMVEPYSFPSGYMDSIFELLVKQITTTNDPNRHQCWFTMAQCLTDAATDSQFKTRPPINMLFFALHHETPHRLQKLIERGIDPCQTFANGKTALQMALSAGRLEHAKILMNHQKIDAYNVADLFDAAIELDDLPFANSLMEYNTDTLHEHPETNKSMLDKNCLRQATIRGSYELFKLLVKGTKGWQYLDYPYYTLLMIAASMGNIHKVDLLCRDFDGLPESLKLDYIDAKDLSGMTAFSRSCVQGHFDCVKVLLRHGVNPGILSNKGDTALHTMAQAYFPGPSSSRFKSFIEGNQQCLDIRDATGATMLHTATLYQNQPAIDMLIACGASLTAQDKVGDTPLHLASRLRFKAKEALPLIGVAALFREGKKIPLDIQNDSGNTALHNAVRADRLDIVEDLVTAGASFDIKNHEGLSPYDMSQKKPPEHPIAKFLLERKAKATRV